MFCSDDPMQDRGSTELPLTLLRTVTLTFILPQLFYLINKNRRFVVSARQLPFY